MHSVCINTPAMLTFVWQLYKCCYYSCLATILPYMQQARCFLVQTDLTQSWSKSLSLFSGALLTWYKATSCSGDPGVCSYNYNTPLAPPLADCPVTGTVNGTVTADAYAAFITSFNGRTDCLCPVGVINCNFVTGLNTQTNYKPFTTSTAAGDTIIITD